MTFTIIIVNWNVRNLIEKCLRSIARFSSHFRYEVIVIDNASADGSVEMIREKFPQVALIANRKNLGFAAAVNQGIRPARGEYIVLLNPDVEIQKSTLDNILWEFKNNSKAGIVGGKIQNEDGTIQPSVRAFPDIWSQILITLKIQHLFESRAVNRYLMDGFDYKRRREVEQVMGAFFVIHRKVIEQIGPMDEKFFLWFEEVDFCKRAKEAGWKIIYTPEAQVRHLGGKSFSQLSSVRRQTIFNKSLHYYMLKHKGFLAWSIFAVLHPVSLLIAFVTGFFHPRLSTYKK